MNQAQFTDWVKSTVGLAAGYAIGRGWGDANLWVAVTGLVVAGVPFAWGWVSNTKLAQVQAAAALPEVSAVVIKPLATDGVAAAAADPSQPKIVPVQP